MFHNGVGGGARAKRRMTFQTSRLPTSQVNYPFLS